MQTNASRHRRIISRLLPVMVLLCCCGAAAGEPEAPLRVSLNLERPILPANRRVVTVMQAAIDAAAVTPSYPLALALVLDRSAAMQGDRLTAAAQAATEIIPSLREADALILVTAGEVPETLGIFTNSMHDNLARRLEPLTAEGRAGLFAALSQGAAELRRKTYSRYAKRLLLITGARNIAGLRRADTFRRLGIALRKEGISVSCVGVGRSFHEDLLTAVSEASDGHTYFLPDAGRLRATLRHELQASQHVFATNITVKLDAADGVHFINVLGRDARLTPGHCEIRFNQLAAGASRYVLIQLQVAPRATAAKVPLATVELTGEILGQTPNQRFSATAQADFTESDSQALSSVNQSVQNAYSLNVAAVAYDESIDLFDQGKSTLAVEKLLQQAELLRGKAALSSNDMMEKKAIEMEDMARRLEQSGMTPDFRKSLRIESYQSRSQQEAPPAAADMQEAQ